MVKSEKKKILLAEDDDSMRRFIEIILKQSGFEVLTAEDGLEAMELALGNKIDAVVADAIMPNLSGFDLCRMVNGNSAETKIPCIILSGLEKQDSENLADGIADAFLTKDAKLKENLLSTLKKLI